MIRMGSSRVCMGWAVECNSCSMNVGLIVNSHFLQLRLDCTQTVLTILWGFFPVFASPYKITINKERESL